jgi:hypothetical protein
MAMTFAFLVSGRLLAAETDPPAARFAFFGDADNRPDDRGVCRPLRLLAADAFILFEGLDLDFDL